MAAPDLSNLPPAASSASSVPEPALQTMVGLGTTGACAPAQALPPQTAAAPAPAVPAVPAAPAPAAAAAAEPSMKLTRGHSCVLCQQRKVRCDKNKPCANCVRAQVECRVVAPLPPRRRKKKPHEHDLTERLRRYEALLIQHGVSLDAPGPDIKHAPAADPGSSSTIDEVDELQHDLVGLKTSPSSSNPEYSSEQQSERPQWSPYKEYRDDAHDSSEDELEGSTIHNAFDSMFGNQDGFPFVVGGAACKVTDSHPHGIQIFQLWQIYLTNVNPLLKVTHTQTLQAQIIEAGANPGRIAPPLEALMFSIYFVAVTSMAEDEVQSTFGEDKARLLAKYHRAAQQALINASFMRSSDILVLQAYFLYLVSLTPAALPTYQPSQISVRQYVDPRSLFCLIGIAVRVAQRLGLHRDGAAFGLPPFEVELRRRLWWQIVAFDKRIAEITGSAVTALSSTSVGTRFPLNINDTDLHLHAKDAPPSYSGTTEMIFCLTRIEMCTAGGLSADERIPATGGGSTHKFQYSPNPNSPDVIAHVAHQTLPSDPASFCAYMEANYLQPCDPKIPLHHFTLLMTRQALCKMRLITSLTRSAGRAQRAAGDPGAPAPGPSAPTCSGPSTVPPPAADGNAERDALFIEAISMIEYDSIIQTTEALRGFVWYTYMHFPFPAYLFLAFELRAQRSGDLVERAWAAICENHDRRGLARNLGSPIHVALGPLFLKAWDGHETAELQLHGRRLVAPKFIQLLRRTVKTTSTKSTGNNYNSSSSSIITAQRPLPTAPSAAGLTLSGEREQEVVMQTPPPRSSLSSSPAVPVQQQAHTQAQAQAQAHLAQTGASSVLYPPGMQPVASPPPPPSGPGSGGGFDGPMAQVALGVANMPDMMDFGPVDWSYFMQGEYGGGGYGGGVSFGSMYGQPGGQG